MLAHALDTRESARTDRDRPPAARQNPVVVPRRPDDAAAVRRFALRGPPQHGRFEFESGEVEHALRVLRLGPGDRLIGLDGVGGAWPLVVRASGRRELEVDPDGDPTREPRPGDAGAPLPWIEVCTPLPRGDRAEAMVDRLVQLGVAAIRPLATERAHPEARAEGARRTERLSRTAREALKQSGRLWLPEIHASEPVASVVARPAALELLLDPRAERSALAELAGVDLRGSAERPLRLWVGPEGGFAPGEVAAFRSAGFRSLRLAPHILRIETAAEVGLAVLVAAWEAQRSVE